MNIPLLLLGGLCAGILSGAFGIGGGLVIVPWLTMLFGFPQKMAQGTSLAMFLIAPSMLGMFTYFKSGNVSIKAAAVLWIGTFVGAFISAYFINRILPDAATVYLKRAFCVLMIAMAVRMWITA